MLNTLSNTNCLQHEDRPSINKKKISTLIRATPFQPVFNQYKHMVHRNCFHQMGDVYSSTVLADFLDTTHNQRDKQKHTDQFEFIHVK